MVLWQHHCINNQNTSVALVLVVNKVVNSSNSKHKIHFFFAVGLQCIVASALYEVELSLHAPLPPPSRPQQNKHTLDLRQEVNSKTDRQKDRQTPYMTHEVNVQFKT